MLCIVDMLVLVHFPVVIMRMGMLICGMATHGFHLLTKFSLLI